VHFSEKLEIRFSHLASDLLHHQNTLFDVFDLVQELRDGTLRHFILKKFFWKVSWIAYVRTYNGKTYLIYCILSAAVRFYTLDCELLALHGV